jgi:hypothetical protein
MRMGVDKKPAPDLALSYTAMRMPRSSRVVATYHTILDRKSASLGRGSAPRLRGFQPGRG